MSRRNRMVKTEKRFCCIRNAVIGAAVILLVGLFARGPLATDLVGVLQQLGAAFANSWLAAYGGSDVGGKVFLMIAAAYFATVVVLLVKDRKERKQKESNQKGQTIKHTATRHEKDQKNPKSTALSKVIDLEKKENRIS